MPWGIVCKSDGTKCQTVNVVVGVTLVNKEFYKYHALGNDYLVIDPQKNAVSLTPEAIERLCHRNFGVGSDGILYGPFFSGNAISVKIYNPDGSEAEKSGNGVRIFSRYLVDAGYVTASRFNLQTAGGEVRVELLDPQAGRIRVDMGKTTFFSNEIPVNGPVREVVNEDLAVGGRQFVVTCLSIGNPHCVIPLPAISKELALSFGSAIENHEWFPNRINVQFLKVLDRKNIQIEIWERGAGYTLASGSSSCAAASAAYRLGLVDETVNVHMPGGTIEIQFAADGHVLMTGSVTAVSKGELLDDLVRQL